MASGPIIVWFRRDLRVDDNPALAAAAESGAPVLPVFLWAPEEEGNWSPGSASQWWLHHSLESLQRELQSRGSKLVIRTGESRAELQRLLTETNATAVYWNRLYDPALVARDKSIKSALGESGIEARSFNGSLLFEPWEVSTKQGKPYQVFTPFWKACRDRGEPDSPLAAPTKITEMPSSPDSIEIESLKLLPTVDWAGGMRDAWQPGEDGARNRLRHFLSSHVADYDTERDRPDHAGTSRLSPHLHFGEISPRRMWQEIKDLGSIDRRTTRGKSIDTFQRELGWREFAHHVLFRFPKTTDSPMRDQFRAFPWEKNRRGLRRWQRGETGYPIVDAGMRELWATGWMHNRVRMIAGSFLTKDLLISWQEGAAWFWDTLVDSDLANNTLGWQWVAGCGADAAPYFRIFNPITQGKKFDPDGVYVRRWVPELANLPAKWIHEPWKAPADVLANAGVKIGKNYPGPIVDHAEAREQALAAYDRVKSS